ncbi:hypothetical protein [Streptomyces sp. NPDC006446]
MTGKIVFDAAQDQLAFDVAPDAHTACASAGGVMWRRITDIPRCSSFI